MASPWRVRWWRLGQDTDWLSQLKACFYLAFTVQIWSIKAIKHTEPNSRILVTTHVADSGADTAAYCIHNRLPLIKVDGCRSGRLQNPLLWKESLPVKTLCWSDSPVSGTALETYCGFLIDLCCQSQPPEGNTDIQAASHANIIWATSKCFTIWQPLLHSLLLLLSRGTKPNNNLAFSRNSQGKISNTHMTAGYHLELWLFSEESALKMVQNAPVKCTL